MVPMSELRNAFERQDLNGYVQFICNKCGIILEYDEHGMDDVKIDQDMRDHLSLFCEGDQLLKKRR